MDRNTKPPDLYSQRAQQSAQVDPVSGTSGIGNKRLPPTTSQQDQSAKKKLKKSNNENEGDVSTIPQESDESECIEVEIIQKGPITVGYGGTIRINANIISNSTGSLKVNWQKTHDNCSTNLMINYFKYSGSSCDVNNPQLVINNVDKEDAGIYKLEVISPTETKSSPGILLELHGDEAKALSKEENNYFRLYILCQKIATQAVRIFFDSKVPELNSFLRQHKSNLTSPTSVYRCTKNQKAKVFPGGHVVVVSADFDFTLLYKLIRNLLTAIPPPTCGWGNKPLPGHLNETDDIERIGYIRNYLSHNPELKIYDADFFTYWTDLSQAIDRLSKSSLSTNVESMRTKIFDKCSKNEIEEDIRKEQEQVCKDIIELKQQVDANKQDIADIKRNFVGNGQEIHNSNTIHIELNTQNNLPEMLSEKGLMYVASKLGFDWNQVALTLDITQAELEQIQLDNPCQVVKQITVGLIRWRNRQRNRPQQDTIKQLIGALEVPGRRDIIDDLRERYGTDYL